MTDRIFRYYKDDFGKIPLRVIHMDLIFDVFDDHTEVTSDLHAESLDNSLPEVTLNAKNLEILTVNCAGHPCTHVYDAAKSSLTIRFEDPVLPQTRFTLHTETVCRPAKNILEGLYYDETPPGAPPQQITQCQQWGFQRLVPCIDDMTAKCTYTTTIIADERYTNLITNGNVVAPRQPAGAGRVKITYENIITPMAPYLFFLGCGTWATFSQECEYPDGRLCTLELLGPPASDPVIADQALDILHDAVLWVNLFTGPGKYDKGTIRERLYLLMRGLNRIKKINPHSPQLQRRSELHNLITQIVPGYEYTGMTYREIGMQNSDFGGMENVGNTTITANRIMPFPTMTDSAYEYLTKVKVHEFYHNLNGSEVTGWSPFEIWLNEAVTVHIENQYHAFHFGEDYSRLQTVLSLLSPGSGTLELDSGAASLPVEPDGFNDPNELITGITYMKAPEFVRMIETCIGKELFVKGLDLYHRRYRHGNATRDQWVQAMEEVSGQQLAPMAVGWLKQTGFPTLSVQASYNSDRHVTTLHLRQAGDSPEKHWIFPIRIALVAASGNDIAEVLQRVEKEEETLELSSPEPPAFISINRGYSFYGKVNYEAPLPELYLQAERDSDLINRYIAFMTIIDREKLRMLSDPSARPDPACIDLYVRFLSDRDLMMQGGGQFLTVFESAPDKKYAHHYQALYDVRERILQSIAARHTPDLLDIYASVNFPDARMDTLQQEIPAIKRRQIKNTALAVLSRLDTPNIHQLIQDQFTSASCATDKLVAFSLYMDSSAGDRPGILDSFEQESKKNPVSWENFLSVIAGNSSRDVLDLISRVEQSDAFRIEQANDQRALYGRFALNRKKSLQTEQGRSFLQKTLRRLAPINEYSTVSMLRVFGALDAMEDADQVALVGILAGLLSDLDREKTPSVYNTALRILFGAPRAVQHYEQKQGIITALRT
ncbi:MAG TPA: M1 family metallopeptidase [Methanoregula sp.]|nr:M1 family metallopeptidase [Methanoregula sp.]